MLGVGSYDGMSRAKHRLGRGATGSDRRDPQTWYYRQHIVRNAVKDLTLTPRISLSFNFFFNFLLEEFNFRQGSNVVTPFLASHRQLPKIVT